MCERDVFIDNEHHGPARIVRGQLMILTSRGIQDAMEESVLVYSPTVSEAADASVECKQVESNKTVPSQPWISFMDKFAAHTSI